MKNVMIVLSILLVLLLSVAAWGREFNLPLMQFGSTETATMNYEDSNGCYVITFTYNPSWCTVPATMPSGCSHYDAEIMVYGFVNNRKELIGQPFRGQYTGGKCFEDKPADLVARAKAMTQTNITTSAVSTNPADYAWKLPDDTIRRLCKDGEVCSALGRHFWESVPHITLEYRPDGNYPKHRKCAICGKEETFEGSWK